MDLQTFEQRTQGTGDTLKASDAENIPLLVKVREYVESVVTRHAPEGTRAIRLDLMDLTNQEIKLGVMWFNGAIVDNLAPHVGKAMAIRIVRREPKKAGGNSYFIPEQLEGPDLEAAVAWAKQKPRLFEDEYERRELPLPSGEVSTFKEKEPEQAQASAPAASAPPAAAPPAASAPAAAAPAASAPAASAPPAPSPAAAPPAPSASAPSSTAPAASTGDDDDEPPF